MLATLSSAACCRLPAGQRALAPLQNLHLRRFSRSRRAAAGAGGSGAHNDSGAGGSGASSGEVNSSVELPPELQGLSISEDGQNLIDSATGKVVNEFGATRFDCAVRAMRGEFDPPEYVENTDRASGLLLDSLTQFPAVYDFQLVVKAQQAQQDAEGTSSSSGSCGTGSPSGSPSPSSSGSSPSGSGSSGSGTGCGENSLEADEEAILERYRRLIADTTAADIPREACTVKRRLGGKYLSLCIPARVQAAHVVNMVWQALAGDAAVLMKY